MKTPYKGSGIVVYSISGPTLEENKISGGSGNGIIFVEKSACSPLNEITGNQIGLSVMASANPELEDNISQDNKKADVDDKRTGSQ